MASKGKKNSNPRQQAVLNLLVILIVSIFCAYTVLNGLGNEHKGSAKNIEQGLDLQGGASITYQIEDKKFTDSDVEDTKYKLQKRVEAFSTESEVYREGDDRITVEIPGFHDANEVLEQLGRPGNLEFRLADGTNGSYQDGTLVMTGAEVTNAQATSQEDNGIAQDVVSLTLNKKGTKAFAEATSANIGKPIYIIYDGEVISAPTVQTAITDGKCVITGMEDHDAAENLATQIRIGAISLSLKELRSNVVGARLGDNALSTSLKAGAIGIAVIIVFMTVVYYLPGFLAGIALVIYIILNLLAINGFNVTLTLPGIAGILLAIGMAVDANVIIFTRIREEIAGGRTVISAINEGYSKALSAIIDGNITTLIAAAVLWIKGSGTVKGFAQTLAIGIILSMFTALFITRRLMTSCYELGLQDEKFYGRAKPAKVRNYVKASKFCIAASLIVILLGFVFMPINKSQIGNILNYDLEFSGGTSVTLTMKDKVAEGTEKDIEQTVKDTVDVKTVQTQSVINSDQIVVKTNELTLDERQKLEDALKGKYDIAEYETEEITASVSQEMKSDAITAVIISVIFMLIYIAFRFKDVRFGASAVLALMHDVLVVLTLYSVARLSVGNTFIACMLTILGYSVNATIVIFDRIRENLRNNQMVKQGIDVVVNTSISQTLTRSINTSLTSFVTIFILYLIGVASIKEFTLALMAGIICGAYSSVCISGPIWYYLRMVQERKKKGKSRGTDKKDQTESSNKQKALAESHQEASDKGDASDLNSGTDQKASSKKKKSSKKKNKKKNRR